MSVRTVLTFVAWLHAGPTTSAGDGILITTQLVDPVATRSAVEARVGAELATWKIEVVDAEAGSVLVRLTAREGTRAESRTLSLVGESAEERSRELAAAIALLIDEASDPAAPEPEPEPAPEPEPEPEPEPVPEPAVPLRGWITLGPRLGLGPPRAIAADVGLELTGGVSLVRDHVQPLLLFGWTTTRDHDLSLHYLHLGAGVAAGAPLAAHRLWLGAGILPRVLWVDAREGVTAARIWNGAGDVFALGHFRASLRKGSRAQLLAGLKVGLDLTLPSIVILGSSATVRRGDVRGLIAASLGVIW